jgi:hypothetical protein
MGNRTMSPYCLELSSSRPRTSRRNARRLPTSQSPRGPGAICDVFVSAALFDRCNKYLKLFPVVYHSAVQRSHARNSGLGVECGWSQSTAIKLKLFNVPGVSKKCALRPRETRIKIIAVQGIVVSILHNEGCSGCLRSSVAKASASALSAQ